MVRSSYRQKPGRRILMEMFGGTVRESPSDTTDGAGKNLTLMGGPGAVSPSAGGTAELSPGDFV